MVVIISRLKLVDEEGRGAASFSNLISPMDPLLNGSWSLTLIIILTARVQSVTVIGIYLTLLLWTFNQALTGSGFSTSGRVVNSKLNSRVIALDIYHAIG